VGLRADLVWVRRGAADPEADTTYEVPLEPFEAAALRARASAANEVAAAITRYGLQHRDAWAGDMIDQASGGLVVAWFTGDLDRHRAAIAALVRPEALWEVRLARHTEAELVDAHHRIEADLAWLTSIGVTFAGPGIDVVSNRLTLDIDSPSQDATADVVSHDGFAAILQVRARPSRTSQKGFGDLSVRAWTSTGRPVGGLEVAIVFGEWLPWNPGVGSSTDQSGTARIDGVPASRATVELTRTLPGGQKVVAGRATTLVRAGTAVTVDVVVAPAGSG
jgi:hypothetical protein